MSYVVNDQVILSRVPEGPLAAYLVPFAGSLSQEGYTRRYIHRQVMLSACFSRWLKKIGLPLRRVTSGHAAQYLTCRYRRRRSSRGDQAALGHFIEFLRREGVLPVENVSPGRLRNSVCERTSGICARSVPSRRQRSSTTYGSSAGFSKRVSAPRR